MKYSLITIKDDETVISMIGDTVRKQIEDDVRKQFEASDGKAVSGVFDVAFESSDYGRAVAVVTHHHGFKNQKENGWGMLVFIGEDAEKAASYWHLGFSASCRNSLSPQSHN